MEMRDVAIVGAGSAGLATASLLRRSGIEPLLLEAGPEPGAAWRGRYDRLRLHTPRLLSGLPDRRIPRRYGRWVARDDLLAYFRDYAAGLDVRTDTRVNRIDRDGDTWRLDLDGEAVSARAVIVATGYNGAPFVPDWPGRGTFAGELIHSSAYRNAASFRGRDVLSSARATRAPRSPPTSPRAAPHARSCRCARRRRSSAARPPGFPRS